MVKVIEYWSLIKMGRCGVDQYVMPTPEYSEDLTSAFQETHVFKFARKTITRFICQIRICVRTEECKKLTPPTTCPTLEQRLLKTKGLREPPGNGVKKILSLDEPDSNSVDAGVESFPNDVHPPASKPENDFKQNTTLGSIYSGY
ncbi:hypothetical protein GCK32_017513, partial [Trichostrongylus colubriformis]